MAGSWRWWCGAFRRRFLLRCTISNIRCSIGRSGSREVGYDNERGKGDHRHLEGTETPYAFTGVEQLMPISGPTCIACEEKMTDVKITVGDDVEGDATRRFVDAWRRAERGEFFREQHLAFESWDALARVLTGKRLELLRCVRRHQIASVRALAKALARDYSNVHADVQALTAAGLLNITDAGLRADYDAIETTITI